MKYTLTYLPIVKDPKKKVIYLLVPNFTFQRSSGICFLARKIKKVIKNIEIFLLSTKKEFIFHGKCFPQADPRVKWQGIITIK